MIPKRLLDEGTELERLLLASGRAARPTARAKWRAGIAFLLAGIATTAKVHAVAVIGAKARAWTVAQWLALGVGTGAVGWVAVHGKGLVSDPPVAATDAPSHAISRSPSAREPSSLPAPPPESAPAVVENVQPLDARDTMPSVPPVNRTKRSAPPATAAKAVEPSAPERSIASEVDELDRARAALAQGEPKRAVDRLNRYERLYPQGILREEALRLRIEAAASTGDRTTLRALAQRFQALYPDSTHSERVKALARDP